MKKSVLLIALMMPMVLFAQGEIKENNTFETFSSSIGELVKVVDYNMPKLKADPVRAKVTVRKVTNAISSSSQCYLQINGSLIAYEDVVELAKVLEQLKTLAEKDRIGDANYLKTQFKTKDGLILGYYIEFAFGYEVTTWYICLDGHDSSKLYFKSAEPLLETFNKAINKIKGIQ